MAIGATLYEELEFDEEGRILNPHFHEYHLPTMSEAPKQTVEFVETPGAIGPFGARGIGEHPVIGVAPAILNAIYDAVGVDFYDIPITPERLKAALGGTGAADGPGRPATAEGDGAQKENA
jgi:CO/xanthine dehydrogenase Mo-binding subunit